MIRTVNKICAINYILHQRSLIIKRYAGHSKWANIRHTKALKDSQRSTLFTKFGRQIRVAIQEGGSHDPKKNLRLEQVIEQAKRLNMPVTSIQSIIKSAQTDKNKCKSHLIEINGPGSCLIICEVFTENLHHVKQILATVLKKHSSKFGDGGVKHLFEQKGVIETGLPAVETKNEEEVLEIATEHAIESGAEDVKFIEDDQLQFLCSYTSFNHVQSKLEKLNYKITNATIELIPQKLQEISDKDMELCESLYEKLENHPDVVKLYDNIA